MGKQKGRKSKSDFHTMKMKLSSRKKYNPFEVHVNKQKHNILGRKKKQDRGLPGVARNKAMKKREKTILQEYLSKNKTSKFVDRRIGENVPSLSTDDKMMARFSREAKRRTKSNVFNLNEDEELTHLGRSIGDIENFDEPHHSDSEEEGNLDRDFVQKAHFGGFKGTNLGEIEKSHKEKMEDIISESKKRKYERKVENEVNVDMTEKLDEYWKTIGCLLHKNKRNMENGGDEKNVEDYDVKVRELKFEAKGQASDRLKTVEEIAAEESEKLRRLEEERMKRMKGDGGTDQNKTKHLKHTSADDLYDGFILDDENDGNEYHLEKQGNQEEVNLEIDGNEDELGIEKEADGDDSPGSDSYSDVLSDGDLSNEDERTEEESVLLCKKVKQKKPDLGLPYVFAVPNSLEEFVEIIADRTPNEQKTIVDRIIKCNHPSLGADNRQKLETFFVILLQYTHDLCADSRSDLKVLHCLTPFFLTLLRLSPKVMSESLLDIVKEMQEHFQKNFKRKRGKSYPDFRVLHIFKIIANLYPISDFRHPVVTPAMIFMSQLMSTCRINTHVDVAACLYLCETFLEYIYLSKRFVPEVLHNISNLLLLAVKHNKPFQKNQLLAIVSLSVVPSAPVKDTDSLLTEKPSLIAVFYSKEKSFNDSTKIMVVSHVIAVLGKIARLYQDLPSFSEIFRPILDLCNALPRSLYPEALQNEVCTLIQQLQKPYAKSNLVFERKKPKPLKQYEPKFSDVFTGRKERVGSQKKLEHQKLVHKFKREMKGAMREIRQDNRFLANRQLRDQNERDLERKRKVKQLYAELSQQEGDFKKLKKKSIT